MGLLGMSMYPLQNISFADFWLGLVMLSAMRYRWSINSSDVIIFSFFTFAVPLVGLVKVYEEYFVFGSWLTNTIRSAFYGLAILAIRQKIMQDADWLFSLIKLNIYITAVTVLVEVVIIFFGGEFSYVLPYLSQNVREGGGVGDRPSGLLDEPSYLGIFLGIHYFVLLASKRMTGRLRVILITLMLLTQSLSAALFLFVSLISELLSRSLLTVRAGIILTIGLAFVPVLMFIFASRLPSVMSLVDGSFNHRILGSWELVQVIWSEAPVFGIGLGQHLSWMEGGAADSFRNFYFHYQISFRSGINNAFLSVFANGGIVLSLLFFLTMLKISPDMRFFGALMALGMTWGFFLHPLNAFFFGVAHAFNGYRKEGSSNNWQRLPRRSG